MDTEETEVPSLADLKERVRIFLALCKSKQEKLFLCSEGKNNGFLEISSSSLPSAELNTPVQAI